jgi:hypothetical protein
MSEAKFELRGLEVNGTDGDEQCMRDINGAWLVVGHTGCLTGRSSKSDWTFSITEI